MILFLRYGIGMGILAPEKPYNAKVGYRVEEEGRTYTSWPCYHSTSFTEYGANSSLRIPGLFCKNIPELSVGHVYSLGAFSHSNKSTLTV